MPTITYTRKKPKRTALPKDLPGETRFHDIRDADKVCGGCGNDLHKRYMRLDSLDKVFHRSNDNSDNTTIIAGTSKPCRSLIVCCHGTPVCETFVNIYVYH